MKLSNTEAVKAVEKYGSQRNAASALGIARSTLQLALARETDDSGALTHNRLAGLNGNGNGKTNGKNGHTSPRPPRLIPRKGRTSMTRSAFAALYDNETRTRNSIHAGVATLVDDDEIIDDAHFRTERCKHGSVNGWRVISEDPAFLKYRFQVRGKVFWTTPKTKTWALANIEGAS